MNILCSFDRNEIKSDVEEMIENFGDPSQREVFNQKLAEFFYQKTITTR